MKVGILGAGQLGRMLALAGYPLGLEFLFLDPAADACGGALGEHLCADYSDPAALARFCARARVATYEFENVPVAIAERIGARIPLHPGVAALRTAQDRLAEKTLFTELGIEVPRYVRVDSLKDLKSAAEVTGLPAVLKTRRLGYDGKGQVVLRTVGDLEPAWRKLGERALILESFVSFSRELSCLAVRALDGETRFYPAVENRHRNGILRVSRPRLNDPMQALAEDYSRRVLDRLKYVGVLAFEFFVVDDHLLGNEIAPRVHNSGHWSIEGAQCSQFENHLRAVTGLPLGSTELRDFSAMVNFIGAAPTTDQLASRSNLHIHLYGKAPRPLRKVGHATITAKNEDDLDAMIADLERVLPPDGSL